MGGPDGNARVVNLAARTAARVGYRRTASAKVARARAHLGMTAAEFAEYLTAELGWEVTAEAVAYWEDVDGPPGEVMAACEAVTDDMPAAVSLLDAVLPGFPAGALAGPWVTAYQFAHNGMPHHHADIAHVTAGDERQVRAVNHPPDPRTQGRASPFRNEIEAALFGRHLIGTWRNTSDTRYFGTLHLAVSPGETVMDGYYTGLASDIEVSDGHWRWVRLEDGDDLTGLALAAPSALYELVMSRTPDDPPLTIDEIREDT